MNDTKRDRITRREVLKGAAAAALAASGTVGLSQGAFANQPARQPNLIKKENAREGAADWQLTRVRVDKPDGCRSMALTFP